MTKKVSSPKIERRRYARVMAPVLWRIAGTQGRRRRIGNLSLAGVRIYSDERLDIGQEMELEFLLPSGSTLGARVRVVWIKELPPGSQGLYDVGLELCALSKKARKELRQVLHP